MWCFAYLWGGGNACGALRTLCGGGMHVVLCVLCACGALRTLWGGGMHVVLCVLCGEGGMHVVLCVL